MTFFNNTISTETKLNYVNTMKICLMIYLTIITIFSFVFYWSFVLGNVQSVNGKIAMWEFLTLLLICYIPVPLELLYMIFHPPHPS